MATLPVSLVNSSSGVVAARRARAEIAVADPAAAPINLVDTPGTATNGPRWLHIKILLNDAGSSITWQLWLFDRASGRWGLDTRPGTDQGTPGTVALAQTDADHPQKSIIEIARVSHVFVRLLTFAGFPVPPAVIGGVDVWLSGVD